MNPVSAAVSEPMWADHNCHQSTHSPYRITRSSFNKEKNSKFHFGTATAAYQIEGCATGGGKGLSIWDTWTLDTPGKISDGSNGNVAEMGYYMFKEDVKLMKKAGFDAYRFSISWPRLLPGGKLSTGVNKEGVKYYNDVIDAVIAEGMVPYVTLFHWDLPLALELEYGGFLNKEKIVDHFRDYAELCFWEFGDRVKHWITMNEACTYTQSGYVRGIYPPGRGASEPREVEKDALTTLKSRSLSSVIVAVGQRMELVTEIEKLTSTTIPEQLENLISKNHIDEFLEKNTSHVLKSHCPDVVNYINDYLISFQVNHKSSEPARKCANGDPGTEPYIVAHNLILAHAAAVDLYRTQFQEYQGGKIGMTNSTSWYLPYDKNSQEDQDAANRVLDFNFYWFVEPIVTGRYPESMVKRVGKRLPRFTPEEEKLVKGSYDFLGVNYYTTYYAIHSPKHKNTPANYELDMEATTTPTKNKVAIGPQGGPGWLYVYPEGLYLLLLDIKHRTKSFHENDVEIVITENGVGELTDKKNSVREGRHDQQRIDYHNDHLIYLHRAMAEGVKVTGYFLWSFCDNFEWFDGYSVRFGIFYVDFLNGRYTRYPKSSAFWWTKFMHDAVELKPILLTSNDTLKRLAYGEGQDDESNKKAKTTSV